MWQQLPWLESEVSQDTTVANSRMGNSWRSECEVWEGQDLRRGRSLAGRTLLPKESFSSGKQLCHLGVQLYLWEDSKFYLEIGNPSQWLY